MHARSSFWLTIPTRGPWHQVRVCTRWDGNNHRDACVVAQRSGDCRWDPEAGYVAVGAACRQCGRRRGQCGGQRATGVATWLRAPPSLASRHCFLCIGAAAHGQSLSPDCLSTRVHGRRIPHWNCRI